MLDTFVIWSGGLRVSSNAGEQYVTGSDDFVESQVRLNSEILGEIWFTQLKKEMDALDGMAKNLYGRIQGYFKEHTADGSKIAPQGTRLFWQLCERDFQTLVDHCDQTEEAAIARQKLRQRFAGYVHQAYDKFCPRDSSRQLDAWAKCRPNNSKYLKKEV
jgi:CRISPR system Cascade subunit CasA